jgi:hypothetical protein
VPSDDVQEMLRRCMEALAFFADYPVRQVGGSGASHSGELGEGGLFLDVGRDRVRSTR